MKNKISKKVASSTAPPHKMGSNSTTAPRLKIFFLLAATWEILKNIHKSVIPEVSIKRTYTNNIFISKYYASSKIYFY